MRRCSAQPPSSLLGARTARDDAARTLLETTTWNIDRIAHECGFASPVTFRQNFVGEFATTPTLYRRRFA